MRSLIAFFLVAFTVSTASAAEQPRYGSWEGNCGRTQEMVGKLWTLVEQAERDRAADPRFLADLRTLVLHYDNPGQALVLEDYFSDGDYTRDPRWVVEGGYFSVSRGGLETRVSGARAQHYRRQHQSPEERAAALLAQIFARARGQEGLPRLVGQRAKIHLDRRISNAFAITAEISGRGDFGGIDLAVYQGKKKRRRGYRLSYVPGEGIALLRVGRRGGAISERSDRTVTLSDGRMHTIVWTRRPGGHTTVYLDGARLFSAIDRGYKDPFDGIAFVNRGGDYTLRQVTVYGQR